MIVGRTSLLQATPRAILFTQEITDRAMATLAQWFQREAIYPLHLKLLPST
jgi:hypothetical protein